MSDLLLDALRNLDTENDANWTQDGLPDISVLKGLLNNPSISRKKVTEAAPEFTRTNPKLPNEVSSENGTEESDEVVVNELKESMEDAETFKLDHNWVTEENLNQLSSKELSQVEEALLLELDELRQAKADLEVYMQNAYNSEALLISAKNRMEKGNTSLVSPVQDYLSIQREKREALAKELEEMGDDAKNVNVRSRIDEALFSRKRHARTLIKK